MIANNLFTPNRFTSRRAKRDLSAFGNDQTVRVTNQKIYY